MSEWKVNPTDGVTNNNNGTFSFDANAPYTVYVISYTADDGCKANYTYRLKIGCGGDTPEPYPDYKVTCIRGTDNGTDVVDGKKYSHPFLCCGKGKDDDMDSLYVDNISYNGSPVSTSKSNPTVINSWLSVYRTTSGGVCGKGALMYMYGENDTNDVRDVTITFTTSDANVCSSAPPAQEYGITNACPSWEVEVKQCKKCDVWCCVKDTKGNCHSYTAVAKPCGECSEYESCGGDCTSDCGEGDKKELSYFESLFKEPFGHGDLSTGETHTYLNAIYTKAKNDFTNNTGGYTLSIYSDSGIKTCSSSGGDENLAFNTFIGWTIAMCLTEIDANKSDELYEAIYDELGGDYSVFGHSTKNNPHIARIAATVEYAISRPNWDTLVTNVRNEKGVYSNGRFDPSTIVRNNYENYYPDTSNLAPSLNFIMSNCQSCDSEIDNDAKSRYTNDNPTEERTKQAIMDKDFCGDYIAKIFGDAMGMNIMNRSDLIEDYSLHGSWASDAIKSEYYGRYRPPRYPNNKQYNGYPLVNKTIEDSTTCEVHPEMTPQVAADNMYPNSYSSGHSSAIWGTACILAFIYPSKYVEIFKRAWVFANNRVVSRYHFYSDTIVGREVGGLILPTLNYYDKFRNSL